MPNIIAYTALLLWPLVCVALFKKLRIERAIIWSILGGYLILPPVANFNLPLVPSMDKHTIPSICALFLALAALRRWRSLVPSSSIARVLIFVFIFGAVLTVMNNTEPSVYSALEHTEPIVFALWELPGLRGRDMISMICSQIIALIPFLLAYRFLSSPTAMRTLLLAFVASTLAISLPALFESRFSPQLNTWIYGFFQHDFAQAVRGSGYRPFLFLQHGLWVAFFIASGLIAATALCRSNDQESRQKLILTIGYLFVVLVFCRSLGSLMYGLALVPIVFLATPRAQVKIALALAAFAAIYPLLRGSGHVPVYDMVEWAAWISQDRAWSLQYRFANEDILLEHASEKPWLGWGGWGRNLVYDVETAREITIPDGRWIITFGAYGWMGYIAEFGLLALPVCMLGREALRKNGVEISRLAAAVALILAINMIDLLVNATLTPITWILAGSCLGHAEFLRAKSKAARAMQPKYEHAEARALAGAHGTPTLGGKIGARTVL